MWSAKENGTRIIQAVYLFETGALFAGKYGENGQAHGGKRTARGMGYSGRGDP